MDDQGQPTNLEELLEELRQSGEKDGKVSIGAMIEIIGRRSFAPLLLLAGLIALSPLSGVPGMPTTVAVLVLVVAGQFLVGRDHFWLPEWLLRREVPYDKFCKGLAFLQRPARFIDRFLRPRLVFLTHTVGIYAIAVVCVIIAATMPPLELMPFAASVAGAALAMFGLSLIAHDGLLGLIAIIMTVLVAGGAIYSFL